LVFDTSAPTLQAHEQGLRRLADALAIALTHLRAQETARLGIPGAAQI